MLVVPPYPCCIEEDRHAVDLEDCWTALPQLFFSCHLRPKGGRLPKTGCHKTGPDDLRYDLVFFSTFADSAAEDGRRGSNVYEVNPWLWQFGRGKPRLVGLTIEETSDRQDAARKASDKRRKKNREGRKVS